MSIDKIKNNLTSSLQKNKFLFKQLSLELGLTLLESSFKVAVLPNLTDFRERRINYEVISDIINENIENSQNLIFKTRLSNWGRFLENEIRFTPLRKKYLLGRYSPDKEFGLLFKKLSLESFDEYWKDENIISEYKKNSHFKSYVDLLVPNEEISNIKKKGVNFNIKGWNEYIIRLINTFFSDFKFSKEMSNQNLRFLKALNNDWLFGFEYNKNILNKSAKTGMLEFPDYFNLVLINKEYNIKSKLDYIYNFDDKNIISLGILGNPFFYPPIMSSIGFESQYLTKHTPPSFYETISVQRYENNKDGTTSILHDQLHGEQIKKYIYLYMSALSYTSKSYLEYIEQSLIDVIADK